MATRLKLQYLGVEWRLERRGMEWRLEERATGMEDKKEAGLCREYLGRGKRWKWRRRCREERTGCGNGNDERGRDKEIDRDRETERQREKARASETRGRIVRERRGMPSKRGRSTETSCDRKRRFSGSHSRYPSASPSTTPFRCFSLSLFPRC